MSPTVPSPPSFGRSANVSPEAAEFDYRLVWKAPDPDVVRDAKALWAAAPKLAPGVDLDERAQELCVVAYKGDVLAAVSTVAVRPMPFLNGALFGMYRSMVAPAFRQKTVTRVILDEVKRQLCDWSLRNPQERLMGLGVVIQSAELARADPDSVIRLGTWLRTGLTVVGFSEQQRPVRLVWFDHARL